MKKIFLLSNKSLLVLIFTIFFLNQFLTQVNASDKLTVGKIQQTLKKGMSQTDVISALGSPNLVSQDSNGNDTWIYDKISTEKKSNKKRKGAIGGVILGIFGVGGYGEAKDSSSSTSQKTLTVIIKFSDKKVIDFKFNASSF